MPLIELAPALIGPVTAGLAKCTVLAEEGGEVWPFVVTVVWVMSLGLALTARYRVGWKRHQAV